MKIRKRYLLVVAMLFFVLFAGLPLSVYADSPAPPYTVTLQYYDNIQITYTLDDPKGGVWNGAGDIPVGGIGGDGQDSRVAGQIYCVDPFVHFHSVADTSWPNGVTTDTMGGYTIAAPWAVSGAMRQNGDAVRWLVANGYKGDYLANDVESRDSVKWLQDNSHIGNIDKTVALIATKIAIWKVLAGDSVIIERTSLDGDPAKKAALNGLIDWMVGIAQNGGEPSAAVTNFSIKINKPTGAGFDDSGVLFYYYGPLTVAAKLENPQVTPDIDKVFLTVSGPESGGVKFVNAKSEDPSAELPADESLYGTNENTPYLDGAGFTDKDGVWTSEDFYLMIPADRVPLNADQLTIRAMGMTSGVTLAAGTPVTFVYGGGGVQDWDFVQAYAGAAKDGMIMDLYAEDQIYTGDTALGQIYVSKRVENGSPLDNGTEFKFKLYTSDSPDLSSPREVDFGSHPVHCADSVGPDWFTLSNGGLALIDGLPAGPDHYYWVVEDCPSGYELPQFIISTADEPYASSGTGASSDPFQIDDADDFAYAMATFVNTKEAESAYLYVGKYALELTADGRIDGHQGDVFDFAVTYSDDGGATFKPFRLDSDNFMSDFGDPSDAANGEFKLNTTDMAVVGLTPGYIYRIAESEPGHGLTPAYALVHVDADGNTVSATTNSTDPNWPAAGGGSYISENIDASPGHYYYIVFSNTNISTHDLTIKKTVSGSVPADALGKQFQFQIFYMDGALGAAAIPLTVSHDDPSSAYVDGISPDQIKTDGANGPVILTMKDGQSAVVTGLPAGRYMVREIQESGFNTKYAVDGGASAVAQSGETKVFLLDGDIEVDFINTYGPSGGGGGHHETPSVTEQPSSPGQPAEPVIQDNAGQAGAPEPTATGHSLVQDGNGYLELDDMGTPLGRWVWDDEAGRWIFNDFTPLSGVPATGGTETPVYLFILLFAAMICIDFLWKFDKIKRDEIQIQKL